MMTYHTGLQFVNHTPFKIVAGSISYRTNEVEQTGFASFNAWTSTQSGDTMTWAGPLYVEPNKWVDTFVELYMHAGGTILLPISLTLDNGQRFEFTVDQKWAYDDVTARPVPVTDTSPPPYQGVIGLTCATRRDAEIKKIYEYGLVMVTVADLQATARWMTDNKGLDPYKIFQITLPGTHDTGTWGNSGNAQCQAMDLRHQLNAGIRFLDVRIELLSNIGGEDMHIYHGLAPTDYLFEADIIRTCEAFLAQNPEETIVMMVSRNLHFLDTLVDLTWEQIVKALGGTPVDDQYFAGEVARILDRHPIILTGSTIPTVEQARGHIVLVTRYNQAPGIALPIKQWPDDATGVIQLPDALVQIQDVYKFGGVEDKPGKVKNKWDQVQPYLDHARNLGATGQWFINFTSGSGLPLVFDPVDLAKGFGDTEGINAKLARYLTDHPKGYYGSVMMDFPEFPPPGDLIEKLIKSNP